MTRESVIEEKFVKLCKRLGDLCFKFTSPARRAVPDRLRLRPIPPHHRALVGEYVQFVELKATGIPPTESQAREHARLRELGYRVEVIDNLSDAERLALDDYIA
jgi:hypothetical protein